MDKFEWLASNSGPAGCPMRINDGDFLFPGGGSLYIPRAKVYGGWGRQISVDVVGEDQKPLPDSVAVLFFSYLEDKFYRAQFALPRDSIARLFREGYRSFDEPSGHGTYRVLVVGVAPGGAMAVWASGRERQVEVFFGRAEPVDLDWHRAFGAPPDVDRREFVANAVAEAARSDSLVQSMMVHVPPAERWAAYRTRYRWIPAFEGIGAPRMLSRVEFVNGERDNLVIAELGAERGGRPAPRFFYFDDPRTDTRYRPSFDEEEIAAAFARAGAGGRPVELVFTAPKAAGADPQVLVRGAAETVPLQHVKYVK